MQLQIGIDIAIHVVSDFTFNQNSKALHNKVVCDYLCLHIPPIRKSYFQLRI